MVSNITGNPTVSSNICLGQQQRNITTPYWSFVWYQLVIGRFPHKGPVMRKASWRHRAILNLRTATRYHCPFITNQFIESFPYSFHIRVTAALTRANDRYLAQSRTAGFGVILITLRVNGLAWDTGPRIGPARVITALHSLTSAQFQPVI